MTPDPIVTSVFTAADAARAAHLAAENARLRADIRRLRDTLAARAAQVDLLQRANAAKDSPGFKVRKEAV